MPSCRGSPLRQKEVLSRNRGASDVRENNNHSNNDNYNSSSNNNNNNDNDDKHNVDSNRANLRTTNLEV